VRTLKLITNLTDHNVAMLVDDSCMLGEDKSYGGEGNVCIAVTDVPEHVPDSQVEFTLQLLGEQRIPVQPPTWRVSYNMIERLVAGY
jgi:hypothetical protein